MSLRTAISLLTFMAALDSSTLAQPRIDTLTIAGGGASSLHTSSLSIGVTLGQVVATTTASPAGGVFSCPLGFWPARIACPGDLNNDGVIDDSDFVLFATAYDLLLCSDPSMPANCPADLNGDALVSDADFVSFAAAYDALVCP
ncbi:MAG: hypothetical protein ACREJD_16585 [Phycisphaerales bacterium]